MSEYLTLTVRWLEPPSYWAEDFAPSFSGPAGWYVCWGQDTLAGPFEAKAKASRAKADLEASAPD